MCFVPSVCISVILCCSFTFFMFTKPCGCRRPIRVALCRTSLELGTPRALRQRTLNLDRCAGHARCKHKVCTSTSRDVYCTPYSSPYHWVHGSYKREPDAYRFTTKRCRKGSSQMSNTMLTYIRMEFCQLEGVSYDLMYHEYMLSHYIQEDDARFPLAQVNNNVSVEVLLKVIGPFHHWRGSN
jgi:hypothetical protein